MITKLDKVVTRYLVALNSRRPRTEPEICHWLDKADAARFAVLDMLIRKPRYRRVKARVAWKRKDNPHRPVTA